MTNESQNRLCCSCGKHEIAPEAPKWATKCYACYSEFRATFGQGEDFLINIGGALKVVHETLKMALKGMNKYCGDCGEKLDRERRMFALRRTSPEQFSKGQLNECRRCYLCSKKV